MYVGITRAMEKLYISYTRYRMKYGRTDNAVPSRFLEEIPEKLFESRGGVVSSAKDDIPFDLSDDLFVRDKKKSSAHDPFADFEREVAQEFSPSQTPSRRQRQVDPAIRHIVDKIFADDERQEDPNAFEPGDKVRHEIFGDGVVDAITGSGLNQKIRINFRREGMKLLLLSMVGTKLTKM
jgi:DNA helicase-2/ATP-dependent DNA helicase PcrA